MRAKKIQMGLAAIALALILAPSVGLAQDVRPPNPNDPTSAPEISSTSVGTLLIVLGGVVGLVEAAKPSRRS
jgi:hypothetical protein